MKKMMKMIKNQKGLTLVELLAVIVILAIIVAIAVPVIGNIISNSEEKAEVSEALNIIAAAKLAHNSNKLNCEESACLKADLEEYVDRAGSYTSVSFNGNEWSVSGHGVNDIDDLTTASTSVATETELLAFLNAVDSD